MLTARHLSLASIGKVVILYLALVGYGAIYEYFYAVQLTTLFVDDYTAFDWSKLHVYRLICFLTPLAILPLGTRLRAPGQFIAGAIAVLLFIPIPIVFVPMVGEREFWGVYALLWLGCLAVCSLARLAVPIPLPTLSERAYNRLLLTFFLVVGLGFAYCLATNHFGIVSLNLAHAFQNQVTISGLQGYLLIGFVTSFGGLLIAMAIMLRRYSLLILAFAGFVCCYGLLLERNAILMPAWITYICIAQRFYFRDSTAKYLLVITAPLVGGVLLVGLLGLEDRESVLYAAFTLAGYRLFSVPAIGFNVYYNFFAIHPMTYWSHIGLVSRFVHYPYGEPLAAVMAETYKMGNDNASFIQTDGLAAAGAIVLPFISVVFGLVLVGINSLMRGLNVALLAIVMAGGSIALADTGIGPGLLSNGIALLSGVLFFAPRSAVWNLRSLRQQGATD